MASETSVREREREALGARHRVTLAGMNSLALLYQSQGRHLEAEPLLRDACERAQATLGPVHPTTLRFKRNRAWNLAALGRAADALRQLQELQPHILDRLVAEFYTIEARGMRYRIGASQAGYQDMALSLALLPGAGPAVAELAASAVLRLKGLRAEEDAFLARLARHDPRVRVIAAEIAGLRGRLATAFLHVAREAALHVATDDGEWEEVAALAARLQAREFVLGRASRDYARHLQVRDYDPTDLRAFLAVLPRRAALFELYQYRPAEFRAGALGPRHWAGLLIGAEGRARVLDLGPVEATQAAAWTLVRDVEGEAGRSAARALYDRLLGPLAAEFAGLERLYLAPDGHLCLVPFAALLGPDGRRLAERLDLRLLQTGRDLLRPAPDRPATGLLALGGIDFDADTPEASTTARDAGVESALSGIGVAELRRRTAAFLRHGFPPLPGTAEEVHAVAALYRAARPHEPVEVWTGASAGRARLKAPPRPPRALHLATHGFCLERGVLPDRPLLLSGIALAGANRALREPGRDGILHAIEVQDLDLDGTELVVLSACDTGLGQIEYGEGVSGLVRALRTAGARHVLVTLCPVSDEGAADFVQRFYRHWLAQAESDPPAAFRAAQLEAMAASPDAPIRRDQTWAHFVLIGV